ncbi:MAG: diguanylate cyclase [Phycisphaerales bacterium]|nr:diguanylate cyclase [Phycisphaerales bacterium]
MAPRARILVIGSSALAGDVTRALPRHETVHAPAPLAGLWCAGHTPVEGVLIALEAGRGVLRAVRALREITPNLRIVVACDPAEEPRAREALRAGADDYILAPLRPEDVAAAFGVAPPRRLVPPAPAVPSLDELVELGEVLQHLTAGPQATAQRLVALLRKAFGAVWAQLELDDLGAVDGQVGAAALHEPLRRQGEVRGALQLGPRANGTAYHTADAAHFGHYARLTEVILAQAAEQERWQELAWRDDLTGLHNRRYFDRTLEELLERAGTERLRVTVVLFDIDDFKSYNDTLGHAVGDTVLREVAQLLLRCSRAPDVVARYGGDEFALILWDSAPPRLPGSQHPSAAVAVAERFRDVLRQHAFACLGPHSPGVVTISGGLACYPWDGQTRAELVAAADRALLEGKRGGKDQITLAEPQGPAA